MLYGLYVSAAGALANSHRQDVVANNLANVNTVSFKRDLAQAQARLTEAQFSGQGRYTDPVLEGTGGGIFALPTHTDFSPASLDATGRDLDLALEGRGFFQVQQGDTVQYTRDGRFTLNESGQLITYTDQLPVLDESGGAIHLDRSLDFKVNDAGLISQGGGVVGRLGVVDFADTSVLVKQGNNLYVNQGGGEVQPALVKVKQGVLENSGVNAITEMVEMIEAQRAFQTNLSMLQLQDQTLGLAVGQLGSIS
ncbi:MAG: flagellar hook-basal body protein [Planctomycetes bacterium]|nr:flagellar hook-basal body protein [Planctomycetota bacterium]